MLNPGTLLGPYEIQAALGAGGMGEVYRARDTRLHRLVAVKVLPADVASDPDRRQRLQREARAIAAMTHPHICTLHDVGHDSGVDYLVMEYLEGETLAARIARGRLPLDQALRYASQIAIALSEAHRAGIAHRDLKPLNVMIRSTAPTRRSDGPRRNGRISWDHPAEGEGASYERAGGNSFGCGATFAPGLTRCRPRRRWFRHPSGPLG